MARVGCVLLEAGSLPQPPFVLWGGRVCTDRCPLGKFIKSRWDVLNGVDSAIGDRESILLFIIYNM